MSCENCKRLQSDEEQAMRALRRLADYEKDGISLDLYMEPHALEKKITEKLIQAQKDNHNLKMDNESMKARIILMENRLKEKVEADKKWRDDREAYDRGVINGHIAMMARR